MTLHKLSNLAAARFTGPESGAFLQSQLSADILALENGDATFACYCTPRGQVLGLLAVCRREEDYLVIAAAGLLPGIVQRLRMFVLRTRVEFSLLDKWTVLGSENPQPGSALPWFVPGDLGLAYALADPSLCITDAVDGAGWKKRELIAGVCWLDASTSEGFIPQMLGFDRIGAVSFSKGCYPGQEIVARTRYLGKVKRTPLLVRVKGPFGAPNGERLKVQVEGDWQNATLIDSAVAQDSDPVLFLVTRADENTVAEKIEWENRSYRCATI